MTMKMIKTIKKECKLFKHNSLFSERTSLLLFHIASSFKKKKEKEKRTLEEKQHTLHAHASTHTPLHHHGARAGIDAPVLLLCLLRRRLRWGGELLREQRRRRRRVERRRRGGGNDDDDDDDDDEDECERD